MSNTFQFPETKKHTNGKLVINENLKADEDMDWRSKKCFSHEVLKQHSGTGVFDIKQSPINIDSHAVHECHLLCNLEIHYKPSKCHVERTPQGIIRLHWDTGSYITYNKRSYELKYIYFHTPSMHLVDGNSSQMEINLYHVISEQFLPDEEPNQIKKDTDKELDNDFRHEEKKIKELKDNVIEDENHPHNGKKTNKDKEFRGEKGIILSILVNHNDDGSDDHQKVSKSLGTKENIFIGQFVNNEKFLKLNKKTEGSYKHRTIDIKVHKDWNIKELIPTKKTFYKYEGSLPFPPCTQGYTWLVFDNHTLIMEKFIHNIRKVGNPKGNREPHPLNDRLVYYNNNILLEENDEDDEDDELETKNKMVKKVLAPIRIQVEDRDGELYRKEANAIVNSYSYGANKDYYDDEEVAKNLSTMWNEASKLGYVDETVPDILALDDKDRDNFYKNVIWQYYIYSEIDYLDLFLRNNSNFILNPDGDDPKEAITIDMIKIKLENGREALISCINKLNGGGNIFYDFSKEGSEKGEYSLTSFKNGITNFSSAVLNNVKSYIPTMTNEEITIFQDIFKYISSDNNKAIFYLLLDWHDEYVDSANGKIKLFDDIHDPNFKYECMKEIIEHFKTYNNASNIVFRSRTTDLTATVEGHECQRWGSNQVHHEGSIFNIFTSKLTVPEQGYKWEEINDSGNEPTLKAMIRDGTLEYDALTKRWKPHNKCRNPGNTATAAWCYTTNPDERWAYCMKPNIKIHTKKYILIMVFLMIVFLSYYMVKLIFRHELFTQFIAALTGAKAEINNAGPDGKPPGSGK